MKQLAKFTKAKFNPDGSDTKEWSNYKRAVIAAGGMIGNSPRAIQLAVKNGVPSNVTARGNNTYAERIANGTCRKDGKVWLLDYD